MTALLDTNVLIALVVADHVHHGVAEDWFTSVEEDFATCPITEGGLLRMLIRGGQTAADAVAVLGAVAESERHEFWPDAIPYPGVALNGVLGHRQVTDAYLAQLARTHRGRLATFDRGLAALHADVADLLPTPAAGRPIDND